MAEAKPADEQLKLLRELVEEVRLLREAFDTFSNGGFPLRQTVPTSELMLTACMASSLMQRDLPVTQPDANTKMQMAIVLADQLGKFFDEFQKHTQTAQLESLAQR